MYEEELEKRKVIADASKRRALVLKGALELAEKAGGQLFDAPELVDEVTMLVENPVPLLGRFDPAFLEIPDEVLISEMQQHQRYLPIVDATGKLMPSFVVVANTTVEDEKISLDGYRRVLTARFQDGKFFFETDQQRPLFDRVADLESVRFHRDLGSIHQKVGRVVGLAFDLARAIGESKEGPEDTLALAAKKEDGFAGKLARAGWLTKADLTTHMVFEFPELQGVIGAEYARKSGELDEVADAVAEHYLPRGAEDSLPKGTLGALLGAADRMDSIAGIFSVQKGPTGSADPFGLRRAALGVIAILRDRAWHLSLEQMIRDAVQRVGERRKKDESQVIAEVSDFFRTRLKGLATSEGVPTDVAEAVLSAGYDDVIDVLARAHALAELRKSPDFEPIAVAFKRVANILRKAREENKPVPTSVDAKSLDQAEQKLHDAAVNVAKTVETAMQARDFAQAFGAIASIRPVVDEFFVDVRVEDDDPDVAARRRAVVHEVQAIFAPLADFTRLS